MLDELHVNNIALIEDATIEFAPGLTALTGETGTGKTALLTALKLICGQRADSQTVRDGAGEAVAEARIVDGEEHVVRRRLSASGRSRCSIDGEMATVAQLATASDSIRIHSQHEQVALLHPAVQLGYLDDWISERGEHLTAYREARSSYLGAKSAYDALVSARDSAAQELEFMRFTASEIEKVSPREGEYEELEGELPRLQHAEQLATSVHEALSLLNDDGAALDLLARSTDALSRQQGIDAALDEIASRLLDLESELEDTARDLSAYAEDVHYDPQRLQDVLERLDALSGLMKRFGPGMDQVLESWQRAQEAIRSSEASPEQIERAQAELDSAEKGYREAAGKLVDLRHRSAEEFCAQLAGAVHELAMEDASFEFKFTALDMRQWNDTGSEQAELLYRPSAVSSARPLKRIASGGELSRILLALECMHHGADVSDGQRRTIVFDEVDQGIGGVTGTAVARRLAELSSCEQVIVVTHLPQVAAVAQRQYVVVKERGDEVLPKTSVALVSGEERVAEIARMLAGTADDTALEHARSLLAEAGQRS